jgi:tetratricopeptide (TPR) repeat protein
MKVRRVSFALVSAAFLAAFATSCGTAYANSSEANQQLVRKAYATLQAGDAKTAIGEFSDAISSDQLEPELLANALLNRALAYQQLKDSTLAVADYDAAIKLNVMAPALRSTALYNRGLAHQKLGNITNAIEDFTSSLLINPEFAQAFYSRGNALRETGQLLFALSDYERALRYNHPDKARVHFGYATTFLALKRPLDAKREFNAALSLNPDYGEARAQLVLLGDENASLETASADPILTGSVSVYSGGTNVTKPELPAAVDVPTALESTFAGKPAEAKPQMAVLKVKKMEDRVPETEEPAIAAAQAAAVSENAEVVEVTKVAAIAEEPVAQEPDAEPEVPAAPAVAEEEKPTAPVMSGWTVQVASAASEDAAWSIWKKMQSRFKVLKTQDANVVRADLGSKGVFYRIRLGSFEEQVDAKKACSKLKAGGVSCYISKVGG